MLELDVLFFFGNMLFCISVYILLLNVFCSKWHEKLKLPQRFGIEIGGHFLGELTGPDESRLSVLKLMRLMTEHYCQLYILQDKTNENF